MWMSATLMALLFNNNMLQGTALRLKSYGRIRIG